MIEGRKTVLRWFENTGFKYWFLYRLNGTSSGNYSDRSSGSEDATAASALADLDRALANRTGDYTICAAMTNSPTAKGMFREDFRISYSDREQPQPAAVAAIGSAGHLTEDEIAARIQKGIEDFIIKRENEELKKKVADLEKQVGEKELTGWDRIGNVIADLAPTVLPLMIGNQPTAQVAGLNYDTSKTETMPNEKQTTVVEEPNHDDQARLENVINILAEVDPSGWLDKLEKLALKVKANPSLLNMVNSFL